VVRPEPESRIALPDTIRACKVVGFVVKPPTISGFDLTEQGTTEVKAERLSFIQGDRVYDAKASDLAARRRIAFMRKVYNPHCCERL